MDHALWDIDSELLITHEIWGNEVFYDLDNKDPAFFLHEQIEVASAILRAKSNAWWLTWLLSIQISVAAAHSSSEAFDATTPTTLQATAGKFNFATVEMQSTAASQISLLKKTPAAPQTPMIATSWQTSSQTNNLSTPQASSVPTSKDSLVDSSPVAVQQFITSSQASPPTPPMTMTASPTTTSIQSTHDIHQPPPTISQAMSQSSGLAISKVSSISTLPTTFVGGTIAIPEIPLLSRSQIEIIFAYQPMSFYEERRRGASRPLPQVPTSGVLQTNPIITDTNHEFPIVIDDTDDETSEVANGRPPVLATLPAQGGKSRIGEPNNSNQRNVRKRARAKQAGIIEWVRPEYEKKLLAELESIFYGYESCWTFLRGLPEVTKDADLKLHDALVQKVGQTSRAIKAVLIEDIRALHKSHMELAGHLSADLDSNDDKSMIGRLEYCVDEMQDHLMTLSSIEAYRSGEDDIQDRTYHPSKKCKR